MRLNSLVFEIGQHCIGGFLSIIQGLLRSLFARDGRLDCQAEDLLHVPAAMCRQFLGCILKLIAGHGVLWVLGNQILERLRHLSLE